MNYQIRSVRIVHLTIAALIAGTSIAAIAAPTAQAAACVMPETDYGTVTINSSVAEAGIYRIWARMAAPNSSDNNYMLEIDGSDCYTVGGSSVPIYTESTSTRFENTKDNWISQTTTGTNIDVSLTAGVHSLKLIGTSIGVAVDRVVLTKDITCVPVGLGDNCASIYMAADINTDESINFVDFSMLSTKYGQTGSSLGRPDINNDGVVNFLDYSILANQYEV